MKVKIRTEGFHCSMPIPASMIGAVIKLIPDRIFREIRKNTMEPYDSLITKENISMILSECLDVIKENKGLEIIHVEGMDGTFVSIKL